jgi:hypothetical protein
MKLAASMMVDLDGMYQGPAGPTKTGAAGSSERDGRRRTPIRRGGRS